MPVKSLSARCLDKLLADIAAQSTIGLDLLREIAQHARAITKEVNDPAKRVVAWTLMQTLEIACNKYDGEPMTAEASGVLAHHVRGPVQEALHFLDGDIAPNDKAVALAAKLINVA